MIRSILRATCDAEHKCSGKSDNRKTTAAKPPTAGTARPHSMSAMVLPTSANVIGELKLVRYFSGGISHR